MSLARKQCHFPLASVIFSLTRHFTSSNKLMDSKLPRRSLICQISSVFPGKLALLCSISCELSPLSLLFDYNLLLSFYICRIKRKVNPASATASSPAEFFLLLECPASEVLELLQLNGGCLTR